MCKAHSRAERGRLRQTTSSRECASSARSAFCVIGNSIGISYYIKKSLNEQKYSVHSRTVLLTAVPPCFVSGSAAGHTTLWNTIIFPACNVCLTLWNTKDKQNQVISLTIPSVVHLTDCILPVLSTPGSL